MALPDKITILLADEDALRRDGLAAILQGAPNLEVVAQFADGDGAFQGICSIQPDVAVVDLNISGIHGIELIRRVRALQLRTKVVILSGSTEDDVVREVVRAGGDAYLLKNGPARHLIDAISYVRDGGQYFSPQLRRDGLDRRLMEEPARNPQDLILRPPDRDDADDDDRDARSPRRDRAYSAAPRRAPGRRPEPSRRMRERLRDDGGRDDLADRDYEILDMMADGIKPILDRLEEIEGRVGGMESGDEPIPSDPRGWLDSQVNNTFRESGQQQGLTVRNMQELETRLPKLIEQAVNSRFQAMAEKLHEEIEETHVRTLETFVKNIQVKIVQRVSALETDMTKQAEAMNQLREYSQRTEDNLSRLIMGVDKLAQELPGRMAASAAESGTAAEPAKLVRRRHRSSGSRLVWIAALAVVVVAVALGVWMRKPSKAQPGGAVAPAAGVAEAQPKLAPIEIPSTADAKTRIQAAQEYTERKDYATAEDIYKQVLKSDPNNPDALKGLASVFYREDKIDESAAILEKLK